jgi:hypothetical protein
MPSFDAVNYSLRPNKAVERKIAFSGLLRLSRIVDLSRYRYVGLGAPWFVDFLMAHKILGINSMTSIEQSPIGYVRSEFNRPLACIEVIQGETSLVIPRLALEETPSVIWFDYDSSIGGPALRDIGMLAPRCAPNSIVIVTINAKRDELPDKDDNGVAIDLETSLRDVAGDLVPTPLPSKRLQAFQYPKLLCEILANQLQSATVNSGRPETFIKLFDLAYTDGTPMVTVGGVMAAPARIGEIRELVGSAEWEGIVQRTIAVPPLTVKEKMALDRLMPALQPPTDAQMNEIGFQLKREQIDTYHRYYRHYPVFGELLW